MSIYEKLQTIRVALQEEKIAKSGHNTYSGYDYYELSDFLPAINRHCLVHKIAPIIDFSTENYVTLTLYDFEKPDERLTFYSPKAQAVVKGAQEIQNLGATETYQRRYLYLMAFEISESDTLECTQGKELQKAFNKNTQVKTAQAAPTKKAEANNQVVSDSQINLLIKKAISKDLSESDVLAIANYKFGISKLPELKMPQFTEMMNKIPDLWDEFLKQGNK